MLFYFVHVVENQRNTLKREKQEQKKKKTRSLNVDKMTITIAKAMNPTCPKRNRVKHKLI